MRYFITLLFVFAITPLLAQFTLRGTLIDAETKTTLAGASVFLSNTVVGTVTNSNGEFNLNIPAGTYDLIASFVGYETLVQSVSGDQGKPIQIALKPRAKILDNVVVSGYEKDGWSKWGQFFLDNFLGTSAFGKDCKILNHEVIRFRKNNKENKLTAIALEPLVVENKSLGYRIEFQLENFQYNFKGQYMFYLGYPLFKEMDGNAAKQRRWIRNREEAYYGSIMHFMRAVYLNKIVEEGFEVRRLVKKPNGEKERVKALYKQMHSNAVAVGASLMKDSSGYYERILGQRDEIATFSKYTITGDSIAFAFDSLTAGLEFENYLYVNYIKASPPVEFQRLSPNNSKMSSEISMQINEPLHVQATGNFYPMQNLLGSGYWGWSEKLGNMLPLNYKPTAKK